MPEDHEPFAGARACVVDVKRATAHLEIEIGHHPISSTILLVVAFRASTGAGDECAEGL